MCKSLYNFLIRSKISTIDFFDCLNIARKYNKVKNSVEEITDFGSEEPAFIKVEDSGMKEIYAIFYKNLLMVLHRNMVTDKIVRIYIKRPTDTWTFKSSNTEDILNPTNVHARVYVKYDVDVLNVERCYGENYKSGNWNEMFYKTITAFNRIVLGYTELNKISEAFNDDKRSKKKS